MLRARLIAGLSVLGIGLAGCSSSSLPSWLQTKPPPPPTQALQFESEPPGADVRTTSGQACKTPCSLALPLAVQSVTISMTGYAPQTVPVEVHQSQQQLADNTLQTADFDPNPVQVILEAAKPMPRPVAKPKAPRSTKTAPNSAPKTAKSTAKPAPTSSATAPAASSGASPWPPTPQDSAFPPPPTQPSASSPFPPPPTTTR